MELNKISDNSWELPKTYKKEMKVPGRIYLNDDLIGGLENDVLEQVANVACLPGIQKYSMAMPDAHYGYGFPIGGVAAFDEKMGVISPGGVGFDINCLSTDSNILTDDGYWVNIESLKENLDLKLKIYDIKEGQNDSSDVVFVSERDEDNNIIRTKTNNGRILKGSADHPILTLNGYVPMGMLKEEQDVVVYPFEGVEYEEPSDEVILDEKNFAKYDAQIIKYLNERNLLPLKMNHKQIGAIARLLGFALGDGSIVQENGERKRIYLAFYGKKDELIEVKKDLEKLSVKSSKIYSRNREIKIKNAWGSEYVSSCKDNYIKITSKAFALFMHKLGMPIGTKTHIEYTIPKWIKKSPLWVKRNFLAGLFGADGSKICFRKYTPMPISFTQSKSDVLKDSLLNYLADIKKMLSEFGICSMVYEIKAVENKVVYRLSIVNEKSIKLFLGHIGYEYSKDKKEEGLFAYEYLKYKDTVKNIRKNSIVKAIDIYRKTGSLSKVCDGVVGKWANKKFVERTIYENRTVVRIPKNFPYYEEFVKKYGVAGGFVLDKIKEIKKIPYNSKLYDVSILHQSHNFIANGVVVHNCGVRLVKTNLTKDEVQPKMKELLSKIFKNVPSGLGSKGKIRINKNQIEEVLEEGVNWAINNNYGWEEDIKYIEENGQMKEADASLVSDSAKKRGLPQVGSLGSGNHFLEIQYMDTVFDEEVAKIYGVEKNQVVILIHTGSRGLGHQICADYLRYMEKAARKYNITLPDRQLACAPITSEEGQNYFKAMSCGANYAWTNRQLITHWIRESFEDIFKTSAEDLEMNILYDVAHNIAKKENHTINGKMKKVVVHRKGATRAFGPNNEDIPAKYNTVGQPVIIPGDMGTSSYLMHGTNTAMEETFGSTAHGAGRIMSRAKALKMYKSEDIISDLGKKGILVMADSKGVVAEECPESYKNIEFVADVVHNSGISLKVCKMKPMGVVKG
ncbi:intein-containing RctB family protein [Methanococcus aeolicus]|nr:intein-containing RctB family protein [Methanococcus aeolicus]UXM85220.1 intein-containing RctB family protein [Methanococcus aeolicus]